MQTVKCITKTCKIRFKKKAWNHKYCAFHAQESNKKSKSKYWRKFITRENFALYNIRRQKKYRKNIKVEVLSKYGKSSRPQCCWRNCKVRDLDMLSLDHIFNDGKIDRNRPDFKGGGHRFYLWVKKLGFPEKYQTLCFNHQFKKELIRRRKKI